MEENGVAMINERDLISRVEAADPQTLAEILAQPSPEEERVLRTHFGDARFERMRQLVLQSSLTRSDRTTQGNVVVLHGIMGGELTYYETDAHAGSYLAEVLPAHLGPV